MRDRLRTALAAWLLCFGVLSAGAISAPAAAAPAPEKAKSGAQPAPETVARFARWVTASGDNRLLPFAIIDKVRAEVSVFDADGRLAGTTPALIGLAPGDDSVPGIGERALSSIRPEERTTPAGRFVAGYGPAAGGQVVLWVDYETAVSLHPLKQVTLTDPKEKRLQRLKTPTPQDNRVTYGCINVPDAFYEDVVRPAFRGAGGVVYVLPDTRPLAEVFPTFEPEGAATEVAEKKSERRGSVKAFFKKLF